MDLNNPEIKKIFSSLTQDNPDYMQKAQQIWSMLDDMSQNDPNAYQKFIQSQFDKNKDEVEKKKEKELEKTTAELGKKGKFIFRLKFTITRKSQKLKNVTSEEKIQNKFLIGDKKSDDFDPKKFPEEGEIFLNVFEHEK